MPQRKSDSRWEVTVFKGENMFHLQLVVLRSFILTSLGILVISLIMRCVHVCEALNYFYCYCCWDRIPENLQGGKICSDSWCQMWQGKTSPFGSQKAKGYRKALDLSVLSKVSL